MNGCYDPLEVPRVDVYGICPIDKILIQSQS